MIDLSQYPVLDHHCHAFIPEKEMERGISFAQSFHLTQAPEQENENLILYKRVIIELARVLECGSKKPSDIIAQRNKAYPHGNREKQIEYITKLFDDAKIAWLFFDTGFPTSESLDSYDADAESLGSTFMKQKFKFIFRFEQLMWRLFNQSLPFDDMLDEYSSALTKAVKQEGYIGFKSAIAYGYGLDVHDHDIESARKAYEELREKNLLTIP